MARFAHRHLTGVCAAVSVESQYVLARFARRHLWGICAAISVGSQRVVACFARRHLTRICTAVSVGSQYVVARFARKHLQGYLCGDQCWGHSAWWLGCFGVNIIGLRPSLQSGKTT